MRDKEAVLLVDDSTELSFGFKRNFDGYVKAGLFSRTISFNGTAGNGLKTEQEIEKRILETYDDFFKKNDIDFSTFEAVYTSADVAHSFGVYLTLKHVHYYYCEAAQNHIKSHFPIGYPLGTAWVYADVMYKYGAYNGNNPLITPVFYPQSENPFPPDKKVEYFDPDVSKIPTQDMEKLLVLWGFDPSAVPRKSNCLVVCSSNWNIKGDAIGSRGDEMMKNYGGNIAALYCAMIQLSFDYFLRDGFTPIVKWHPTIEIPDTAVNLPGAIPVNRLIDMAFFDYLIKQNNISFEQVLSYGSTAVSKADISDKSHLSLLVFVYSFHLANRMFAILKMIEKLAVSSVKAAFLDPKWRCYADTFKMLADVLFGIKTDIVSADKLSAEDGVVVVVDPVSKIQSDFYAKVAKMPTLLAFFPAVDVATTPDGVLQYGLNGAFIQRRVVKKLFVHSVLSADDEPFNIICLNNGFYAALRDFQFAHTLKYAKAEISLKPLKQNAPTNMRVSRVLITGGGSGIGLAVAKRLLEVGCRVCITGRSIEKLRKAQAEIGSDKLSVLQWDVKDITVLPNRLLEAASLLGGYFDGLVQSAGIYRHVFINNTNEAVWDDIMNTNAKATFFIMQKACQYFQQNHIQGNVCNVSSCTGDSVTDISGPYAASKLLCTKFTRSFGKTFARHGIVINGVAPGVVRTDMSPRGGEHNLLGRVSTPDEIAETVMFLLNDVGGGGYYRG
jgi:NAD(P)-dependent dehydrogenase (short-subunit alcohol dehydrogenase family)